MGEVNAYYYNRDYGKVAYACMPARGYEPITVSQYNEIIHLRMQLQGNNEWDIRLAIQREILNPIEYQI